MKKCFRERIEKLLEELKRPLLISKPHHLYYLTGFTGFEGYIVVAPDQKKSFFFLDGRYWTQFDEEVGNEDLVELVKVDSSAGYLKTIGEFLKKIGENEVEFEPEIPFYAYSRIKGVYGGNLEPIKNNPIKRMREVKEEWELERIRKGAEILKAGYRKVAEMRLAGMKEEEVETEMEYFLKRTGGKRKSFDFIVASGPRSALPHGFATEKVIRENEVVTLDSGVEYELYQTDMTRNFFTGDRIPDEVMRVLEAVREAQEAALKVVAPGVPCKAVDEAARKTLEKWGYGEYFVHGTGHGVGLEVHENPRVSSVSEDVLKANSVITIEPGVYLPGKFGIRIEDLVVVRENGVENLSDGLRKEFFLPPNR